MIFVKIGEIENVAIQILNILNSSIACLSTRFKITDGLPYLHQFFEGTPDLFFHFNDRKDERKVKVSISFAFCVAKENP